MPRSAALAVLRTVDHGDRLAREALDIRLRRRRLAARDRDLASELVYGTLRRRQTLDHLISAYLRKAIGKCHGADRAALRLGAYQLVCLDRVPVRAAVHTTVEALKATKRPPGFVNAVLRRLSNAIEMRAVAGAETHDPRRLVPLERGRGTLFRGPVLPDPLEDQTGYLAAAWSHPPWLVERFTNQHGPETALVVLAAGITRPPVALRPAAGRAAALGAALTEAGVEHDAEGRCLLLTGGGRVPGLPGFDAGWFAVQDPTAAEVVPALDPPAGATVLEICAAPGGKTVELAERVGPTGAVLAVDVEGPRLEGLRREVTRRGLEQVAVLGADAADPEALPRGPAEKPDAGFTHVLIDVPCSNTGVLARRVEARHRLEGPHRIAMLAEQAAHLLLVAASRLAKGGRLVYSTCSIDREENQVVVALVLAEDQGLSLVSDELTLPVPGRRGGGYAAILTRKT